MTIATASQWCTRKPRNPDAGSNSSLEFKSMSSKAFPPYRRPQDAASMRTMTFSSLISS